MEITISGSAEEIAALVVGIQGQQSEKLDEQVLERVNQRLQDQSEEFRIFQ